ncbi:hypothetical protein MBLNU457_5397t1 [Dothideomycetes sp. NU457]
MSSFFRSAADITESGEDTSGYDESSGYSSHAVTRASSDAHLNTFQQNVLFASLLEEKCLNDVCEELNNGSDTTFTKEHPTVKKLAAERYQAMSAQLTSHGLAPAGFEHDSLQKVRQRARDGLSILSQNLNTMQLDQGDQTSDRPVSNQALVKSTPVSRAVSKPKITGILGMDNAANSLALSALSPPRQEIPHPLVASHPLIDSTRYIRDFEEIRMLGKGGYGTVHQCNHRLDGYSYAVKKIPLASSVLYRVQQKGPSELNAILTELRTMAGMEHPNIVRYYGGWIEWSTAQTGRPRTATQQPLLVGPDAVSGASEENGIEFSPVNTIDDDEGGGILFEESGPEPSVFANSDLSGGPSVGRQYSSTVSDEDDEILFESSGSELPLSTSKTFSDTHSSGGNPSSTERRVVLARGENGTLLDDSGPEPSVSSERTSSDATGAGLRTLGAELQPVITRSTVASVSDEDVEYVTRNEMTQSPSQDTDSLPRTGGPSLTLHIQMSLYPLTLSDYLHAAPPIPDSPSQFSHCFHLPSAAQLLLAILSGVTYLHSQNIVHRDLKPANIFLHPQILTPHHHRPSGSTDPFACSHCPPPSPNTSSKRQTSMKVCIGDFGLVSTIHAGPPSSPAKAVGTELYRPATTPANKTPPTAVTNHADPSLDVFALGIIFVELLYSFQTRMERHEKLSRLRQWGEFPADFCDRVGGKGGEVQDLIRAMLGFEALGREEGEMVCLAVRRRVGVLIDD